MKVRASVHLGDTLRTILIYPGPQEKADHLILRLAAALAFHAYEPFAVTSTQHPALAGQEFVPDLLSVDEAGELRAWIECGRTSLNKLQKVAKRYRQARVVVLTGVPREGRQLADRLADEAEERVEVWSFQEGEFDRWAALVSDRNDIIGEASESSMNLVINDQVYMTDLRRLR